MTAKTHAITGAYSYTGKYTTRRLLDQGHKVITLTGKPVSASPFGGQVPPYPFNFDHPEKLAETLSGVDTLFNTYWVRYNHGEATYAKAIENTRTLFRAAKQAGVRRIVHVSIANPSADSPLPYYAGKAALEADLQALGVSYAILRPTVIFGREDILINNIAWFLRRFPVFGMPGRGEYRLQPIFVEDMAALAVTAGERTANEIIDATGPETFTFRELLEMIQETIGIRRALVPMPPMLAYLATQAVGAFLGDVILTREEVKGLMDDLLATDSPPAGETRLSEWAAAHKDSLGKVYANEVRRHFSR